MYLHVCVTDEFDRFTEFYIDVFMVYIAEHLVVWHNPPNVNEKNCSKGYTCKEDNFWMLPHKELAPLSAIVTVQ